MLGDAQGIPFFVNNHQVSLVSLYFYSFAHYELFLERIFAFCFQFCFAFFAGHIDTFGPLFCFGERHAPLFHETLIFFTYIFLSVIASYVLLLALVFIYHHVQSYQSFVESTLLLHLYLFGEWIKIAWLMCWIQE